MRTACTIAVARRGEQRSSIRIFQALRVALARSPRGEDAGVADIHIRL
jgi:hypothetical protein